MISVITTVHNKEETISECINSILNQDYSDFEMIIVDDGSTDASPAKIAAFLGDNRIRTFHTNHVGHSIAKNRGAKSANGMILYFIDADCIADRVCLSRLRIQFDQSDVGCVGGELRALNREHLIARAIDVWEPHPPLQPPGCNVAYRREAFEKAGGFDEGIEFGEDVDLYWRIRKLGFAYSIDPTVKVGTMHPQTILDFFKQRFRWGMGYAQVAKTHAEFSDKEIRTSFHLFSLTLLSSLLMLLDLRLAMIFLVLCAALVLRYVHLGRRMAKNAGRAGYWPILGSLKLLHDIAYYLGYYYWQFTKLLRRDLKDPSEDKAYVMRA